MMQVALNEEDEYEGGRLVFATVERCVSYMCTARKSYIRSIQVYIRAYWETQLFPDFAESLVECGTSHDPTQVSTEPAPVSLFGDFPVTP